MKRLLIVCMALGFNAVGAGVSLADDDDHRGRDRDAVELFAKLPNGVRFPEGITANPVTGEIYVGTFDFGSPNKLLRYDRHGHLVAQKDFGGTPLLGLAFGPTDRKVYIANFGASKIQRIRAHFDSSSPVEDVATIPGIGAPAPRIEKNNPDGSSDTIIFGSNSFPAPNALEFDSKGNLYVSDSFQGAVFKIADAADCKTPCPVTTFIQDPLLATAGFPPFGANGLAFDRDETALFIANTGDDRILKLNLATKELTVFAESINGADGIAFDHRGRLWVCANQADELVALNGKGKVIKKVGDFEGIRHDGSPEGLLFPASLVILGHDAFVTNLAIPLTGTTGDEPEEEVTRWTISRVRLPR